MQMATKMTHLVWNQSPPKTGPVYAKNGARLCQKRSPFMPKTEPVYANPIINEGINDAKNGARLCQKRSPFMPKTEPVYAKNGARLCQSHAKPM